MYQLENEKLKVVIRSKGAELDSICLKQPAVEYLWSGDPAFWGKKSPVLFPVVGSLKSDTYYFDGKAYQLPRHGFAREMEFTVTKQTTDTIVFTLESDATTFVKFPFHFRFDITYSIHENQLQVAYSVINNGDTNMYFSVGGHPAFKVPLAAGLAYEDYYLEFSEEENAGRWPISKEGLIEMAPVPLLNNTTRLPLTKALFEKDALVFKYLASDRIMLRSEKDAHGLQFYTDGFPFLGIWAAKNADFVCIEPWCGIADSVNTDQQLENKEGIELLAPQAVFTRAWSVTVY